MSAPVYPPVSPGFWSHFASWQSSGMTGAFISLLGIPLYPYISKSCRWPCVSSLSPWSSFCWILSSFLLIFPPVHTVLSVHHVPHTGISLSPSILQGSHAWALSPSILQGSHACRPWCAVALVGGPCVPKLVTLPYYIRDDFHKIRKKMHIRHFYCWNFLFSLALLISMFALLLQLLSPSSHLSFPSPQSLYLSLADHFWKVRRGREETLSRASPSYSFFLSNHGAH